MSGSSTISKCIQQFQFDPHIAYTCNLCLSLNSSFDINSLNSVYIIIIIIIIIAVVVVVDDDYYDVIFCSFLAR